MWTPEIFKIVSYVWPKLTAKFGHRPTCPQSSNHLQGGYCAVSSKISKLSLSFVTERMPGTCHQASQGSLNLWKNVASQATKNLYEIAQRHNCARNSRARRGPKARNMWLSCRWQGNDSCPATRELSLFYRHIGLHRPKGKPNRWVSSDSSRP